MLWWVRVFKYSARLAGWLSTVIAFVLRKQPSRVLWRSKNCFSEKAKKNIAQMLLNSEVTSSYFLTTGLLNFTLSALVIITVLKMFMLLSSHKLVCSFYISHGCGCLDHAYSFSRVRQAAKFLWPLEWNEIATAASWLPECMPKRRCIHRVYCSSWCDASVHKKPLYRQTIALSRKALWGHVA